MTSAIEQLAACPDSLLRIEDGRAPDGLPYDWPNRDASSCLDSGGVRWHLQRAGRGPGLLLLHGTGASTHTWRDLLPGLAKRFDVVALDLPGHAYSSLREDGQMTLDALSSSVAELLADIEFRPDYVVGHSAGAAIGLRMTVDEAVLPRAVVGLNAALLPFGGRLNRVFAPLAQLCATTSLMPRIVSRRARDTHAVRRVLAGTGSPIDERGVELYQRLLKRESHVAAVLKMMASWNLEPLIADMARLRVRLHLLAGGRDRAVSPAEADAIARQLPGTSVTRFDDCGHLAHEESPRRVVEWIDTVRRDTDREVPRV